MGAPPAAGALPARPGDGLTLNGGQVFAVVLSVNERAGRALIQTQAHQLIEVGLVDLQQAVEGLRRMDPS